MKANYKEKVEEINDYAKDLKEVATKAPTLEAKTKLTNEEVFGKDFVSDVRGRISADKIFLTDDIIKADLHLEVAIKQCGKLLRAKKYKDNENEIREIAILFLCASICRALFSRAKDIKFKSYANGDYWQKFIDFQYLANNKKLKLMTKLGLK